MKILPALIPTVAMLVSSPLLFAQVAADRQNKSETIRGFITGVSQKQAKDLYVTSFEIQDGKSGETVMVHVPQKAKQAGDVNVQLFINEYVVVNNVVFAGRAKKKFVLASQTDLHFLRQSPEWNLTEPE